MKAADFFRALDDSDLDPYETRYLIRVWRRGLCWEKLESIAQSTHMSIGKASQVRQALLGKGWLKLAESEGRLGYEVAIPDVVEFQDVKSIVVEFHENEQEFHHMKPEFHVVNALPINRQNEDCLLRANGGAPEPSPLTVLQEHFVKRTGFQPNAFTPTYERDWQQPLERLLELTHGDPTAGCDLIDRALAVARGENERRKVYTVSCPRSIAGMATNLVATRQTEVAAANADSLWQRATDFAGGNGAGADSRLVAAIRAIGFPVIRAARADDIPRLKQQLATEYQRAATA